MSRNCATVRYSSAPYELFKARGKNQALDPLEPVMFLTSVLGRAGDLADSLPGRDLARKTKIGKAAVSIV